MISKLQTVTNSLSFITVGVIAFVIFVYYLYYRKNVRNLNAYKASKMIRPGKIRFFFSWMAYCFVPYVLGLLFIRIFEGDFVYIFAWLMLLSLLAQALVAYPYYTIVVRDNTISAPTRWGWFWKRDVVGLNEIDKNKVLRQYFGRVLGTTIIYSTSGVELRTLGLNDSQLLDLLNSERTSD